MDSLPPALTLEGDDSFAWHVFHQRHPELIRRLNAAHPYGPEQREALSALAEESRHGVIAGLPDDAPDRALWRDWELGNVGTSWAKAPFLWAESYFYRRLLEVIGYFAPGAWNGVDPFAPFKAAELRDPELDADFAWLNDMPPSANPQASFDAVLTASLYGNRADLGFRLMAAGTGPMHEQLVADDSLQLWQFLTVRAPIRVTFVLDNAGPELLSDLIFADHLLVAGLASEVVLHTKPFPYYVSDATTTDVGDCLRRLAEMPGEPGAAGRRVHQEAADGRVRIRTYPFYCAPLSFHHMPESLADDLGAGLTIFKGDLNYRRLVGDCAWDPTSPFHAAVSYLPGPAVALRTLKSEVVVGLSPARVRKLDDFDASWRVNGTQALVQAVLDLKGRWDGHERYAS
ncbi:MAG: damage-control phosphatase ARMT1 family protein [Pseudonocardiaceae bacterium]